MVLRRDFERCREPFPPLRMDRSNQVPAEADTPRTPGLEGLRSNTQLLSSHMCRAPPTGPAGSGAHDRVHPGHDHPVSWLLGRPGTMPLCKTDAKTELRSHKVFSSYASG